MFHFDILNCFFIIWLEYNRQQKLQKKQDKMLKHLEKLEIKQEHFLEKTHLFEENSKEVLNESLKKLGFKYFFFF